MIALKDNLPLVEYDDGHVAAFERDWLLRSLSEAARKAGYHKWWLAEHVAESVTTYLSNNDDNVVTVPHLTRSVQSVLQVIGYSEIAKYFDPGPPLLRISLRHLALAAGNGYELAFFELLGRTIRDLMQAHAASFDLVDLGYCVKILRSKKIWSRDCDALQCEIVEFVREQISACHPGQEIAFTLS